MTQIKSSLLAVALIIFLLGSSSIYTVHQVERAIVLRLGKLVKDEAGDAVVFTPGLHFKIPFISKVLKFDKRLQTLDIQDSRIVTNEKKDVIVSSFIKWRIQDFSLFYRATNGDVRIAENLLMQKVSDGIRAEFGRRSIADVVSGERVDLMRLLQKTINENAKPLGIAVIDVRVKRIDLPVEVSGAVYARMRAEREQAAAEHRATGHREAETIRANADATVTVTIATANREAKEIRGKGDAQAAQIYADAYNRDSEFYAYYRSLRAYADSFKSKDDLIVLSPDNDFFKYFNDNKIINGEQN